MMIEKLRDDCKFFHEEQEFLTGNAQLDYDEMMTIRKKLKKKGKIVDEITPEYLKGIDKLFKNIIQEFDVQDVENMYDELDKE